MGSVSEMVDGIKLTSVRGRVMGTQTWSETHVKGSGSAVMVKGIGVGSSKTTSTVVNLREVCIVAEDGLQIMESFEAGKVTLMPDQEVTLVRAIRKGMDDPVTVGIHNHSMRKSALTGKDMFPGMTLLLMISPFVSLLAIGLFVIANAPRNPNPVTFLPSLLMLSGNLYWFRAKEIRYALKARVQKAMKAAADEPKPAVDALMSA